MPFCPSVSSLGGRYGQSSPGADPTVGWKCQGGKSRELPLFSSCFFSKATIF